VSKNSKVLITPAMQPNGMPPLRNQPKPLTDAEALECLRNSCDFFKVLSDREIVSVLRVAKRRSYEAGQTIFHQGQDGRELYVVVQGEVEIALALKGGREKVVARASDGDYFGEMGFLDFGPRTATARCTKPTTVLVIHDLLLRRAGTATSVKLLKNFCWILMERLKSANTQIQSLCSS